MMYNCNDPGGCMFLQPLKEGRHVCYCYLIHQQPSTPLVPWVQLIHLQDLTGLDVQLCVGSACSSWTDNRRPSLMGYVAFNPIFYHCKRICGIYHQEHSHSCLSTFAEAVSVIAQMSQCW